MYASSLICLSKNTEEKACLKKHQKLKTGTPTNIQILTKDTFLFILELDDRFWVVYDVIDKVA